MRATPIQTIDWASLIPPEQWAVYRCVLDQAVANDLKFALGGGLAVSVYTGRPRNTKDLDIYVFPADRDKTVRMMSVCGLTDYYDKNPYDRSWIYRGNRDDIIVDAIWGMANKRAQVDDDWLSRGPVIQIFDRRIRVLPAEELIWAKLYVLQRDRCDWPDVLNLIYATGVHLDWQHLFNRVAEDLPLLKAALSILSWISPEASKVMPERVMDVLGLPPPATERDPEGRPSRPDLLDTRPWFCEQMMQPAA
jgi:hypothetical protein